MTDKNNYNRNKNNNKKNNNNQKYDLAIIGGGPAGLTASIYASRYRLSNLIISEEIGGMAWEAPKVCNFPSEKKIPGSKLINKIKDNVEEAGGEIKMDKVLGLEKKEKGFVLNLKRAGEIKARGIILATGTKKRKLGVENEDDFLGNGISYCATCDGPFHKGKTIAVVGGANSAVSAALYLADIASKVYLIYRRGKLRANPIWVKETKQKDNIEIIYNTNITSLKGNKKLEEIILDKKHKNSNQLKIEGVFIEIGSVPEVSISKNIGVETNKDGYIKVGPDQSTSVGGVWAGGDVTDASNKFRQIITACSEGAVAANSAFKYFQSKKA